SLQLSPGLDAAGCHEPSLAGAAGSHRHRRPSGRRRETHGTGPPCPEYLSRPADPARTPPRFGRGSVPAGARHICDAPISLHLMTLYTKVYNAFAEDVPA